MSKTHSHAPSVHSYASSTGSAAAKARARAEAAKARLSYAEEEINLKLEKAKLEASMQMLEYKKETAAAIAEAEVLEAAADINSERRSCDLVLDSDPLETIQRTQQYVADQGKVSETEHQRHESVTPTKSQPFPSSHGVQICKEEDVHEPRQVRFEHSSATPTQNLRSQNDYSGAFPSAYPISPNANYGSPNPNDFVRYLARRELVSTGLLQFNDKPQNYRAWKRSFLSATSGLDLTASEEMDLLLKWLGKESKEHAEQIRAIHVNHPGAGLDMIWERLDRTYGSTEAIEDSLFKRIDTFPKVGNRDYTKLTKLSDLLMELLSAKDEGDLPGLSFLDTARGVNPIVQKLPFRLQEKWASAGASYKRREHVPYPPFTFFVEFVSQEASIANDPSFNFITQTDISPRTEKLAWQPNKHRGISVCKTDVSSRASSDSSKFSSKLDDCDKVCPIHGKPHPLRKCRAFREKPIDERKMFLKEHNLCFKCCSASSHLARDCKVKVQCSECKSERHNTALHPGPAPWIEVKDPAPDHGGEEVETLPQSDITAKCTKVCGGDLMDRSCSKICLVKVYPAGNREKAVKLYAILDEQSNRSLVRSQFFEVFGDKSPCAPYILRTCAGVKE